MCSVSMIMDHYNDEWQKRYVQPQVFPPILPLPTQQELDEFRRLLDRAREYDRKHGEPDCELAEKRGKLLDLAKQLGVDISFVADGAKEGAE
jgi:hypothetical protein